MKKQTEKEVKWQKQQKSHRDQLVQQYNNRVHKFIVEMIENPTKIKEAKSTPYEHTDKNNNPFGFGFKKWENESQRMRESVDRNQVLQLEAYDDKDKHRVHIRTCDNSKQIQPEMRYNFKNRLERIDKTLQDNRIHQNPQFSKSATQKMHHSPHQRHEELEKSKLTHQNSMVNTTSPQGGKITTMGASKDNGAKRYEHSPANMNAKTLHQEMHQKTYFNAAQTIVIRDSMTQKEKKENDESKSATATPRLSTNFPKSSSQVDIRAGGASTSRDPRTKLPQLGQGGINQQGSKTSYGILGSQRAQSQLRLDSQDNFYDDLIKSSKNPLKKDKYEDEPGHTDKDNNHQMIQYLLSYNQDDNFHRRQVKLKSLLKQTGKLLPLFGGSGSGAAAGGTGGGLVAALGLKNPKALRFSTDMMRSKTSRLLDMQAEEAKKKEKLMFKKEKPEELAKEILMLCNVYKKSPKQSDGVQVEHSSGVKILKIGDGHLAFDKSIL